MLALAPIVTLPMTAAVGAMNAVGWMLGIRRKSQVISEMALRTTSGNLLGSGRKEHLGPGLDRSSVLQCGMPGHSPDEVSNRTLECRVVRRLEAHDIDGASLGGHLDPEK